MLDYSIEDTYKIRLENLNGLTYNEYLKSEHWKKVKEKAKSRLNYQSCEFCNSKKVELHHTSYKWINTNRELSCIIALCRKHHQEVHDFSFKEKISVRIATNRLRKIYKPKYWLKNR